MNYFPINLNIAGRRAVVVGGGKVALRKIRSLVACDAAVTVVSPKFCDLILQIPGITCLCREYCRTDIEGACLAIGATDSREVNRQVWEDASKLGIPVNVVDQPELCTFTVPAVIARGELLITVATGGASPALARQVRQDLEGFFGPAYGIQLALLRELRGSVLEADLEEEARRDLFRQMAAPAVRDVINAEGEDAARCLLRRMLREMVEKTASGKLPGLDNSPANGAADVCQTRCRCGNNHQAKASK